GLTVAAAAGAAAPATMAVAAAAAMRRRKRSLFMGVDPFDFQTAAFGRACAQGRNRPGFRASVPARTLLIRRMPDDRTRRGRCVTHARRAAWGDRPRRDR